MNKLSKGGLALGGAALAAAALRRTLGSQARARYSPRQRPSYEDFERRVLILGGGFAGYNAARSLCELVWDRSDVGVMLIDKENYLTFWPMVAGVVSSDVGPRNIAQPLRKPLIRLGASFRRAEAEGVDFERRVVQASGKEFPYDHLVVAIGAQPSFFGIPGVAEHSIPMRGIPDATSLRNRVIELFEGATIEGGDVPEARLTFAVIGAGATGVEIAANLHELIHEILGPEYPNMDEDRFRIVLLDALPNILPELDSSLRRVARSRLASLDIEILTETLAEEVTEDGIKLKDNGWLLSENVVWTAGNRPNERLEALSLPLDEKTNGVKVDERLRVQGLPNVWAMGDSATVPDGEGGYVPPNAQAAVQEGEHLARNVLAAMDGREPEPFRFRSQGQLIELGSQFAVNDVMGVKFSGRLADLFWRGTYLVKLESPQNRARQALDWALELFSRPSVAQIREPRE